MIEVKAHEAGVVRVFSITPAEAEALRSVQDTSEGEGRVARLLGVSHIDTDFVEVFPVSDLDAFGFANYLIAGNGIPEEQVEPDRAKLDALTGWALILYSGAFDGASGTLSPDPALTHIGTYAEPRDTSPLEPLHSEAATEPVATKAPMSKARQSGMVASLALVVLFALVAVMIWVSAK